MKICLGSSRWVERLAEDQKVVGSTPTPSTCLRDWHIGCAPAFQAGQRGSTPLSRSWPYSSMVELQSLKLKTRVRFPVGPL